jgi:hypothetical protein
MTDSPVGNDGIIAAHLALTIGVIAKLKARGLLSDDELTDIIDQATLGLEEQGLTEPTRKAAHANLVSLLAIFLGKPFPTPP